MLGNVPRDWAPASDDRGGPHGYTRGGRQEESGLGRLLYAVAASAALCAPAAQGAEPRATVQGELDPELRAMVQRVIGETDRPIENRFEARRRARAAAEDAIATLRSEGYYAYRVEPEVTARILRRGARLYEVPISYYGRTYAEGKKITWRDGLLAVGALVRFRFSSR